MSRIFLTATVAVSSLAFACSAMAQIPSISLHLKPISTGGEIHAVEVTQTLSGYAGRKDQPLLEVPVRVTLTLGQAYGENDVTAYDDAGVLPLSMVVEPAPPGYPLELRTFAPGRDTEGAIRLNYKAVIADAMTPRRPGPAYDLRGVADGFGGTPWTFALLPRDAQSPAELTFAWDFSDLPTGASAVSVRGEGNHHWVGTPSSLYTMFFLAGRVEGYTPKDSLFRSYWIGQPPFEPQAAAQWSAQSFETLRAFFSETETEPYTLLMRPYTRPRDGGGATRGGFMLEYGVGEMSIDARRIMFTHEMVHHFIQGLDGDSSANAWFGEGLAEFYKLRLPLRAGLIDISAVAEQLSVMADAYYTSPTVNVPYDAVARMRWAGGAAQNTPYTRGFMYFVTVDAAIRSSSNGTRSLDDLVLAMLVSRNEGRGYDVARWRELLQAELGDAGPDALDRMFAGEVLLPPADAFGPCFELISGERPRPILGFSEDALLTAPYVVSGLEPGSAAETAGLRNGDIIVSSEGVKPRIAHSASNVVLSPRVVLNVRRGEETLSVDFSTEGPVSIYQEWRLVGQQSQGC